MKDKSNKKIFIRTGWHFLVTSFGKVGAWVSESQRRRRACATVSMMSDHNLRDIGISKGEILLLSSTKTLSADNRLPKTYPVPTRGQVAFA